MTSFQVKKSVKTMKMVMAACTGIQNTTSRRPTVEEVPPYRGG